MPLDHRLRVLNIGGQELSLAQDIGLAKILRAHVQQVLSSGLVEHTTHG